MCVMVCVLGVLVYVLVVYACVYACVCACVCLCVVVRSYTVSRVLWSFPKRSVIANNLDLRVHAVSTHERSCQYT